MKGIFSHLRGGLILPVIACSLFLVVASGQAQQKFTNPYQTGQCTWYAFKRFYEKNNIVLSFVNPSSKKSVSPGAEYMVTWADPSSPYFYQSSTPMVGSLVSRYNGSIGHVEIIEQITTSNGKITGYVVSEANWTGPGVVSTSTKLTTSEMSKRGNKSVFTLIGFLNPNFAPQVKNLKIEKTSSTSSCRVAFTPEDTDGRKLSLLGSLTDSNGKVIASTSLEADSSKANSFTVKGLIRGKTYRYYVWAWDFKGLKSSTTYVTINW
jgi:surface antigen